MKSLGMYMALAGIISIVLHFMNMNLRILMWIDMWSETTGWMIRAGLIIVGLILFILMPGGEEEEATANTTE